MTPADTRPAVTDLRSYFLAGVMQGARRGAELADQSYRETLTGLILRHRPAAVVHDPGVLMRDWLGADEEAVRRAHAELAAARTVHRDDFAPALVALTDTFHRLTRYAADSDVCVAWLPGHEPSMGTACEMFSAWQAGRTVVAITPMRQNLAVLACAHHILPDLDAFEAWLADGGDLR